MEEGWYLIVLSKIPSDNKYSVIGLEGPFNEPPFKVVAKDWVFNHISNLKDLKGHRLKVEMRDGYSVVQEHIIFKNDMELFREYHLVRISK